MKQTPLKKLELLSTLKVPSAAAVPDALALVEEMIPSIGSLLLWSDADGEVAGAYSTLIGMEEGLSHYATQFSNSQQEKDYGGATFRDHMERKVRAERFADIVQVPMAEFRQSDVYRVMMAPYGIEDIARVPVTADDQARGGLALFRGVGARAFQARDLRVLEEVSPLFGRLLDDTEDAEIPVIAAGRPTHAVLDENGNLVSAGPGFRQHLAMFNQNQPGEGPARFVAELPEGISSRARQLGNAPQTLLLRNAWGRFQLYLDPLQGPFHCSLVVIRMLPINLQIFRSLGDRDLSIRQLQMACGLAEGSSFQQLANTFGISRHSVITHTNHLYDKLGVSSKDELLNRHVWSRGLDLPSDAIL